MRHLKTSLLSSIALAAAASPLSAAHLKVPAEFATIADAIVAAGEGDTIVIAEGKYHESLVVGLKKDLTIRGKGKVVIDADGAPFAMDIAVSVGVRVEGLTFREASDALVRAQLSAVTFEDCRFKSATGDGLRFENGARNAVVDCVISDVAGTGLLFDTVSSYIDRVRVVNAAHLGDLAAIRLVGRDLSLSRSEIEDDGVGVGIAVGENGSDTHHVIVTGNEVTGAGDGILLDDATGCLIADNVVRDSTDDSLDMNSGADGNVIERNTLIGSADNGVELSGDENVFTDNDIRKSGNFGFWLIPSADGTMVVRNKVKQSGAYGFRIQGDGNTFLMNVAKKSAQHDLFDSTDEDANHYVGNAFETVE